MESCIGDDVMQRLSKFTRENAQAYRTPGGYGIDVTFGTEHALGLLLQALGHGFTTRRDCLKEVIDEVVERLSR